MKLGDKIYELRKKSGLSQEELGAKLNVTRQTVSKWELNQTIPDTDKLMEISKLFGLSLDELAGAETKSEPKKEDYIDPQELKPRKWLLVVLIIIALAIVVVLINKLVTEAKNNSEEEKTNENTSQTITIPDIKQTFNNYKFEMYIGTEYGSSVSYLLDEVIKNNKTNEDHLLTVVYKETRTTDPEEIKELKKNFDSFTKYETSLDYDENKLASVITIEDIEKTNGGTTKNNGTKNNTGNNNSSNSNSSSNNNSSNNSKVNDFDIQFFNSTYEFYNGKATLGAGIKSMLNQVISDNNAGKHIITITFNGETTTSASKINEFINNINDFDKYKASVSYGTDKFVNKITIER